jgi:hypothetical protein
MDGAGSGEFWEGICMYTGSLRKRLHIIIGCVEWCSWCAIEFVLVIARSGI